MKTTRLSSAVLACLLLGACTSTTAAQAPATAASASATASSASTTASPTASVPTTTAATSSPTAATATTAPTQSATSSGPWTLSTDGLGPLVLGTKLSILQQKGYVNTTPNECGRWEPTAKLVDQGVYVDFSGSSASAVLTEVDLTKATYATVSGVKVGDSMQRLKQVYGGKLTIETKNGNGGAFKVPIIRAGAHEVVFYFPWESTLSDTDKIQSIISRVYSTDLVGDC